MDLFCKWCHETKDESEFLRRNTELPYSLANVRCCKQCNSRRNKDRYRDPAIKSRQLHANAKWRREHPEKMAEYTARFYEKNPAQQQARARVKHMLRKGYWKRQPCCICGSMEEVEAHHDSYAPAHWETVRWLCKKHHEAWHSKLDPIKKALLVEDLATAEGFRKDAAAILRQIKELRVKFREVADKAAHEELTAWTKVMDWANENFEEFWR